MASTDESPGPGRYRFDDFVVDAAAHALLRDGQVVPLEPKAFAVLLALLRRPGELLPRDDLLDRVWGHRHVTPGVLTRAIAQLRSALGDDPQHPRYIQTRHALGYCFVGELLPAGESGPQHLAMALESTSASEGRNEGSFNRLVSAHAPEGWSTEGVAESAQPRPRFQHWRPRHWLLASLLAAAVLAVSMWNGRQESMPVEASIAVLPFSSLDPDRAQDYFAEGLAVEMHDALAGVEGLKVAARMSRSSMLATGDDVRSLGRRLGVASVLEASVRRDGQRVRINARLTDSGSGYTLWSRSYDRELSDVFAVQTEIAQEVVRSLLGVIPGDRGAIERRLAPTRSAMAFDWYLRGMHKLRDSRDDDDAKQALSSFKAALDADGSLVAAHLGICRVELWRFNNLREAAALDRAQDACAHGEDAGSGSRLSDLLAGDIHRYRGETYEARQRYARAAEDPALRADVHVRYGAMLSAEGRTHEAISEFALARELRPGDANIASMIGFQQFRSGQSRDAIASFLEATRLRPDDAEYWSSLGGLYVSVDEADKAMEAFERALAIGPSDLAYYNRAVLFFEKGDFKAAAESARQALAMEEGSFSTWGLLADALSADGGAEAQARAAYVRAMAMARTYLEARRDDAVAQAALGWYLAALGDAVEARRWAAQAESIAPGNGTVALLNAQTLARLGSPKDAADSLQKARANGIQDARIRNNPFIGGSRHALGHRDP